MSKLLNIKSKTIAIGSDHAGYKMKKKLMDFLTKEGFKIKDFGTNSEESVDYPDYAHPLATAIENNEFDVGITLCGSGNGINMTVNKHQGIRSALCWNVEIAKLARRHNNANICSLPARFLSVSDAIEIIKAFLTNEFDAGRHLRRIKKIPTDTIS